MRGRLPLSAREMWLWKTTAKPHPRRPGQVIEQITSTCLVIMTTDFPCVSIELQQRFGDGAAGAPRSALRIKGLTLNIETRQKSKLVSDE